MIGDYITKVKWSLVRIYISEVMFGASIETRPKVFNFYKFGLVLLKKVAKYDVITKTEVKRQ